jgi:hypothetical protein
MYVQEGKKQVKKAGTSLFIGKYLRTPQQIKAESNCCSEAERSPSHNMTEASGYITVSSIHEHDNH